MNYDAILGLRLEAREKRKKIRPENFGRASRISGVSPADIAVLMIYTETLHRAQTAPTTEGSGTEEEVPPC